MPIDRPHNNILYVAVSFGLVGLFVYRWLFWVLLKTGWKNRQDATGFFTLSALLVILVEGLLNTHILYSRGAFLLTVTVGLQSALAKERVSEP